MRSAPDWPLLSEARARLGQLAALEVELVALAHSASAVVLTACLERAKKLGVQQEAWPSLRAAEQRLSEMTTMEAELRSAIAQAPEMGKLRQAIYSIGNQYNWYL